MHEKGIVMNYSEYFMDLAIRMRRIEAVLVLKMLAGLEPNTKTTDLLNEVDTMTASLIQRYAAGGRIEPYESVILRDAVVSLEQEISV